jgi:hypothetical protein
MRLSIGGAAAVVVGVSGAQDGVQDVDASAGEREYGLVVGLVFGAFARVVGLAGRVAADGNERGLVEDAFEGLVAGVGAL